MTCFMCKGNLSASFKSTTQEAFSTFTADMGGCIVIVKNVPSLVCSQCGETSYSDDVARQLEQIVRRLKDSASTEIAVISYSKKAA